MDQATIGQTLESISQIGIPIFSLTGSYLISNKNKWGNVLCLMAQPFWLYTAAHHQQWGAFFTSVVFTLIWINGTRKWFRKPEVALA